MSAVGFSGTRYGMSDAQRSAVRRLLRHLGTREDLIVHHGDCEGADREFHAIAVGLHARTIGHPPTSSSKRAHCEFDESRKPLPYLRRNRRIVAESEFLIATPYETTERHNGGTWHTVRCARAAKRPIAIVLRDGHVVYERWP